MFVPKQTIYIHVNKLGNNKNTCRMDKEEFYLTSVFIVRLKLSIEVNVHI